jgi:acetyl-CoA carboxylase biotin carboxyl carrier protein
MSKESSFNSDMVRKLAEILNETHLTEIEYKGPEYKIRVSRQVNPSQGPSQSPPISFVAPTHFSPTPQGDAPQTPSAPVSSAPQDPSKHPGAVKAPMVGTAYMSSSPTSAPFASLGDVVKSGQTLMIIEAMKVMNQIKSPVEGVVKQILCKDGDPIEYDQPLFIIE